MKFLDRFPHPPQVQPSLADCVPTLHNPALCALQHVRTGLPSQLLACAACVVHRAPRSIHRAPRAVYAHARTAGCAICALCTCVRTPCPPQSALAPLAPTPLAPSAFACAPFPSAPLAPSACSSAPPVSVSVLAPLPAPTQVPFPYPSRHLRATLISPYSPTCIGSHWRTPDPSLCFPSAQFCVRDLLGGRSPGMRPHSRQFCET